MQTTKASIKKLSPIPGSITVDICPKCQNLLEPVGLQPTNRGTQFVYSCPDCGSEFAFVPVTEFRLFEVIPQ